MDKYNPCVSRVRDTYGSQYTAGPNLGKQLKTLITCIITIFTFIKTNKLQKEIQKTPIAAKPSDVLHGFIIF